jgi:hypothetical protein
MNMPNKQAVITRLKNNNYYNQAFKKVYGDAIFDNTDNAYLQMTKAIASFEKTQFFAPFDSKYDKYLQGKYDLTVLEDLGKSLFFPIIIQIVQAVINSKQLLKCQTKHLVIMNIIISECQRILISLYQQILDYFIILKIQKIKANLKFQLSETLP